MHSTFMRVLVLAVALTAIGLSVAFTLANRVPVRDVQSLAGNRVLVPNADLEIVRVNWSINPQLSLVTDVDLLLFPNSPVWKLKLYEIFVQVSCLDPGPDGKEGTADDVEVICSTGRTTIVMPSHWIGLRPIRVILNPPVNPELREIHDLSFIVTDINPVPPIGPTLFAGINFGDTATPTLAAGGGEGVAMIVGHAIGFKDPVPTRWTVEGPAAQFFTEKQGTLLLNERMQGLGMHAMMDINFSVPEGTPLGNYPGQVMMELAADGGAGVTMVSSFFDVFVTLNDGTNQTTPQ